MIRTATYLILVVVCCMLGVILHGGAGPQPAAAIAQGTKSVKKELVNPANLYRSPNYTHVVAVRGGKTLYVSGQWFCTPKGELVGKDDMQAQAIQAFKNLKAMLSGCGEPPRPTW